MVTIRTVGILGAGVMGVQIAAHCVNAGYKTYLYDLPTEGKDKNTTVNKAIKQLLKLKPSPLAHKSIADLIHAKNYQDDLPDLMNCDLVIEAIAENMDYKAQLYQKIAAYIGPDAVLASNTSGLSITQLAGLLPESLQARFCGIHFFNPPRYMHLVEIIPHAATKPLLLDKLETFLVRRLGKGVIRAKDTPNFIANRVGVFSLLATLHHATVMGLGLDEVDALTGTLIGRPKSATFRTMDVVGLDTMKHVVNTMAEQLQDDPWHAYFKLPDWLETIIKAGRFGQKTQGGIYKKTGKVIEVFNCSTGEYQPVNAEVSDEVKQIFKIKAPRERFEALCQSKHRQAQFLAACFNDLFHYCAHHLETIADSCRDVDLAIRWGFGWQQGPFELWQSAGYQEIKQLLGQRVEQGLSMTRARLPDWMNECDNFYRGEGAYSAINRSYQARSDLPVYRRQYFPDKVLTESHDKGITVFENEGVRLWHQGDDVAILSFKTKVGAISDKLVEGMLESITCAENEFSALVIYQQDPMNFSAGADLTLFAEAFEQGRLDTVRSILTQFQQAVMALKYASIPVVAALRGRALGGGCEVLLHCDKIVAGFESYAGLVEIGVGLLPAGGGCKELALRAATETRNPKPFVALEGYYRSIAMAEVSASATDAKYKGFLRPSDVIVMNNHEVLYVAKQEAKTMVVANYTPPLAQLFKVAGRDGAARFKILLANMLEGHFISDYDYFIASKIADVLCGGDLAKGQWVDEQWMLTQEVNAFVELASQEKTIQRIKHLLTQGKPLRN